MAKRLPLTNNWCFEAGYAALVTTIIIGLLLSFLALAFVAKLHSSNEFQWQQERAAQNRQLAAGCAAKALLDYALDSNYSGHQTTNIGNQPCAIETVTAGPEIITVITSAGLGPELLTLQTLAELKNLKIVSQFEINQ